MSIRTKTIRIVIRCERTDRFFFFWHITILQNYTVKLSCSEFGNKIVMHQVNHLFLTVFNLQSLCMQMQFVVCIQSKKNVFFFFCTKCYLYALTNFLYHTHKFIFSGTKLKILLSLINRL